MHDELSCGAIKNLQTETSSDQQGSCSLSLRYKLDKKSKYTLIAFTTSTSSKKELLPQGGDLVSSKTLKELELPIFDFLCTERNRSFSIHRGAITLFKAHFKELSQVKTQVSFVNIVLMVVFMIFWTSAGHLAVFIAFIISFTFYSALFWPCFII